MVNLLSHFNIVSYSVNIVNYSVGNQHHPLFVPVEEMKLEHVTRWRRVVVKVNAAHLFLSTLIEVHAPPYIYDRHSTLHTLQ